MKPLMTLIALVLILAVGAPAFASDGGNVTNDGVAPVLIVDGMDIAVQSDVICDAEFLGAPIPGVDVPHNRFVDESCLSNDTAVNECVQNEQMAEISVRRNYDVFMRKNLSGLWNDGLLACGQHGGIHMAHAGGSYSVL